ncbi:SRPBCC family protein [Niveibacterium sp. SC-1]|uniref:SRPBCC family protein n=1 Tax=Niveibacterium sp. SC-1 TaxID=3135646 RepID=UPI0031204B4E
MLKTVLLSLLGLLVLLIGVALLIAAMRPDHFAVERSIRIAAPAAKIYPMIEDLRRWTEWSPYEHRDPAMQRSYGASTRGVGATYAWKGNSDVGEGSMRITRADEPQRVAMDLEFIKPLAGHNEVNFLLAPQDGGTRVTWKMEGACPLLSRVIGLFFNMDEMIGKDFEAGLSHLKQLSEA